MQTGLQITSNAFGRRLGPGANRLKAVGLK